MIVLSRAQRCALKRLYDRIEQTDAYAGIMTYRQFRKTISPMFDKSGGIMVPWCGMWLGVERDGYTHS